VQIILTVAEHHSAIVPWQLIAERTGVVLKFVSLGEHNVPNLLELKEMFSTKTKLVVTYHVSKCTGYTILFDI